MVRHLIQTSLSRTSYEKGPAGSLRRSRPTLHDYKRCFECRPVEDQRRCAVVMDRLGTDADDERTSDGCVSPDDISNNGVREIEERDIAAPTRTSGNMETRRNDRGRFVLIVAHLANLYRHRPSLITSVRGRLPKRCCRD